MTSRRDPRAERTRHALIVTAERLFAERGVGAVSLRDIAAAAGQQNPAVVQYHFGSKEGLVGAILAHRRPPVNELRERLLAGITATEPEAVVRGAVEALVLPLAQFLDADDDTPFLRLLHLLVSRGSATGLLVPDDAGLDEVEPSTRSGYEALRLIARAVPVRDPQRVEIRLRLAVTMFVGALAERDALQRRDPAALPPRAVFVDELVAGIVAMLMRPDGERPAS